MIGWVRENWLYGVLGVVASMIVAPGAVAQVPVLGGLVAGDAVECVTDEEAAGTGCDEAADTPPESLAMRDEDGVASSEAAPDESASAPDKAAATKPRRVRDSDGDGVRDRKDNCPDVANPGQRYSDGVGNKCDIPDECAHVGDDPTFVYPRPAPSGRLLTMVGTPGNDVFFGERGGVNVMYGMGGNDCFIGGFSNNVMFGGGGDDVMLVNTSRNFLYSRGGNDTIVLRPGEHRHRRVRCFGFTVEPAQCTTTAPAPEPGSRFDVEGLRIRRDGQVAERLWRLAVNPPPGREWPGFGDGPVVIRG